MSGVCLCVLNWTINYLYLLDIVEPPICNFSLFVLQFGIQICEYACVLSEA